MTNVIQIKIDNLVFDCRVSGHQGNKAIILLHGFPETSYMWIPLMEQLSSEGYYCVAPDMRGYSQNACPRGVANYTIRKLYGDILHLSQALGLERFHLIGHDWGAIIGWHLTHHFPERILSWTALSVPHPRAIAAAYKQDKVQREKSRYIKWFMVPFLPEVFLRRNDLAWFRRLWKRSRPEELENYLSVFRNKKCLTAALNYYRANFGKGKGEKAGPARVPTLFIWGRYDLAVSASAAENNQMYVSGEYTFLELEAGHWLMQSKFTEVATAITAHLKKNPIS
jgi:pimeloyl-ACP methyl ester carboxylesterase